jgi:thymidylate kinase
MKMHGAALIAVEGVNGAAVAAMARTVLADVKRAHRGGVSGWDASGVFGELAVAEEDEAGLPSARTLLLLYANDLAFRLRWEIKPALAEGRTVIAAPYVESAVAFGRAAGLPRKWLQALFHFAPRPGTTHFVAAAVARPGVPTSGLLEFISLRRARLPEGVTREKLVQAMREHLDAAASRTRG